MMTAIVIIFFCIPTIEAQEALLLKLDTAAIPVAMWGPTNLFVASFLEWEILFLFMVVATGCNAYVIHLVYDLGHSPFYRVALLMAYGPLQMMIIGWHVGFSPMWCWGTFCYLLCSCFAPPMHHFIPRWATPWHHRASVWTYHEDFHAILFLADVIYFSMAV